MPFPLQGLVINQALDKQPPNTTPAALNVRGYNPRLGRDQGGQRSGLSKYCPSQINGGAPIQELADCVYTGSAAAVQQSPNGAIATGNWDGAGGLTGIGIYDHIAGTWTAYTPIGGVLTVPTATCWDASGNFYVILTDSSSGNYYVVAISAATGTTLWTSAVITGPTLSRPCALCYGGGYIWAVIPNAGVTGVNVYQLNAATGAVVGGGAVYTQSKTNWPGTGAEGEIGRYAVYGQGVLAIGYQQGYVDFYNTATKTATTIQVAGHTANTTVTDIDTDQGGFFYVMTCDSTNNFVATSNPFVTKFDANGNQKWQVVPSNSQIRCLCYDPVNRVVAAAGNASAATNLITYNPSTGAVVNSYTTGAPAEFIRPSGFGDYIVLGANVLSRLSATGTVTWNYTTHGNADEGILDVNQSSASSFAVGPLSPAQTRGICVSAGSVFRFDTTGNVAVSGGSNVLNPGTPAIFSDQVNQQLYFADGVSYQYYDAPTDSVKALTASSGSLPTDALGTAGRLICRWRNRLVVSGLRYDPTNWFMSAVGDPTNWNYNPSPSVETQAVAGNNSTAGESPDVINALVPYSDEILLFGGDHTIYQMTGDPMSGGRIDLVADSVGMAFGRPWCRDGQGNLYFVSSRGSVYQFVPGGLPQRISDPIAELLLTVQSGQQLVRMAWDERQFGLHVFLTYTTNQVTKHYFYDVRNQSWWQDQFANIAHNPHAVYSHGGYTPGDRVILLGGQDGYVRRMDQSAVDDDGTPIQSQVFIGPVKDKNGLGVTLADLQCNLDSSSGPVSWSVYAGPDAQDALNSIVRATGTFSAGRNRSQMARVFGHALFVALSSTTDTTWQLEYLRARLRLPEGKTRQRAF